MRNCASSKVQNLLNDLYVFLGNRVVIGGVGRVEEVNHTLAGLGGQRMGRDGDILSLLDTLRVQKRETTLADRADNRVIWERVGF